MDPLKDATPQQVGRLRNLRQAGAEIHQIAVTPSGALALDISTPMGDESCGIVERDGKMRFPKVSDLKTTGR